MRSKSLLAMLTPLILAAAHASHAAGLPAEIGAGSLWLESAAGAPTPVPALETDVRIRVAGIVARVSVTQQFRNDGTAWAEAVYAFPLPGDAAVDHMTIKAGDRLIEGEIHEREQAQAIFRRARATGQHAGLVSESRPNLFTTAVANVAPGERIDVTIEYLETAAYANGEFSLRFPMTATPRYGAGRPAAASDGAAAPPPITAAARASTGSARGLPDLAVDPRAVNEAAIHAVIDAGLPLAEVTSRYDEVRAEHSGTRYEIETVLPAVTMNHDFVLAWRPNVGGTPAVTALAETEGDATYALLMVLPPADLHVLTAEPRELILVVDTSGSMGGASLRQAKRALTEALGRLGGADRFNVFQFNSTTSSLYRVPMPLTAQTYAEALRYVDRLAANGGTVMAPAIRAALDQPATRGYLRQVVFLTDGGVADETELFALIQRGLGDARLFTVGIGAAPNTYFMRKAASFGRGTYTHIADSAEVGTVMGALFEKLGRVALTDIAVDWPDAVEFYPEQVPDLYIGEPVVIAARLEGALSHPLSVRLSGSAGGTPWSRSVSVSPGDASGIAALWARRKIESLLDGRVQGFDERLVKPLVVNVALRHHLVSPYTSLVAVDRTPARGEGAGLERKSVAAMPPAGAVYGGFPQTGTPGPLYRLLGLTLLAAAAAGFAMRRSGRRTGAPS